MTTASANLILLDTSIWIDYFRKKDPIYDRVEGLIEEDQVAIIRFITAELLQGAKSAREFNTLKGSVEIFHLLEETPDSWTEAARLAYELRQTGKTVGLADCYITVLALQHNVLLWSLDHHFQLIRTKRPIKLFEP